ncbi:MAG: nicotinate-nucleotide adenylyltransferase [Deltaproteobacteria bacterium]|nr:nicotinate-nucleotide adenylyltransferase [Deltaproteobacteria bacterium]
MKTGIFGGTFNPPHIGHLRLAEEASERYGLVKIIFVPCHQPPHKDSSNVPASSDRLNMTTLACAGNHRFEVSGLELNFAAPSYTVNTLKHFRAERVNDIYFIMGSDSLSEISTWKDYENLFILANFIVVDRPGISFSEAWNNIPIKLLKNFSQDHDHFTHTSGTLMIPSSIKGLDISSTEIRTLVKNGLSAKYLTPDPVLDYIREHNLYSF